MGDHFKEYVSDASRGAMRFFPSAIDFRDRGRRRVVFGAGFSISSGVGSKFSDVFFQYFKGVVSDDGWGDFSEV